MIVLGCCMEIRIKGQMTIADIRQALFEQFHELETKYAVSFLAAPRSTSIPRMHSVRTLRPASQAAMSSEPCTARVRTGALRMRGNYDQTTPIHRPGGGAGAVGPDGRAADTSTNAARCGAGRSRPSQITLLCRSYRAKAQDRKRRPDKHLF